MVYELGKEWSMNSRSPPPHEVLKFNIKGCMGKFGPVAIGRVLHNIKGEVLHMFTKHVGIRNSNEAEVSAIWEARRTFLQPHFMTC